MVDTISAPSGSAAAAIAGMTKLQTEISQIADQLKSGKLPTPTTEVENFRRDVRKSPFNTIASATDIGMLIKDESRLNAISALTKSDPVDFYKVRLTSDGQLGLGALGDDQVRVQLLTRNGAVIADNDEKAADQSSLDNYDKLKQGRFDIEKGIYVLRVSRKTGIDPTSVQNYAVQLTMGDYTKDYDTVAKPANAMDRYGPTTPEATQNLFNMLNNGATALNNLGPIGQPASSKLLGALYSGSY